MKKLFLVLVISMIILAACTTDPRPPIESPDPIEVAPPPQTCDTVDETIPFPGQLVVYYEEGVSLETALQELLNAGLRIDEIAGCQNPVGQSCFDKLRAIIVLFPEGEEEQTVQKLSTFTGVKLVMQSYEKQRGITVKPPPGVDARGYHEGMILLTFTKDITTKEQVDNILCIYKHPALNYIYRPDIEQFIVQVIVPPGGEQVWVEKYTNDKRIEIASLYLI